MCCLYGVIDYGKSLTTKQLNKMVSILSRACEVRGDDATGIAYNIPQKLCIYKRPIPAYKMRFKIPAGVNVVMGHTRMTTQGDENRNYNNHPFYGRVGNGEFALAHNGMLYNDTFLRKTEKLPETHIETDSYIAVQLIEQKGSLDALSLKYMAERLEGSFTITVLDRNDTLFFAKGDNPLCLYHFPKRGLYIYASTEEILKGALSRMPYKFGRHEKINVFSGDILEISASGQRSKTAFDNSRLFDHYYPYRFDYPSKNPRRDSEYVRALKYVAVDCGYSSEDVDSFLDQGFTTDDIEELFYTT